MQKTLRRKVAALHAAGLNDCVVASRLGVTCRSACYHRRALGLPVNPRRPVRVRRALRRWLADEGYACLGDTRHQGGRPDAALEGWPCGTTPKLAEVLRLLYARGPLTVRQMGEALGARSPWTPLQWLKKLKRLGAVRGRKGGAYDLTPDVRAKARPPLPGLV